MSTQTEKAAPEATSFTLQGQLLAQGRTMDLLAKTDLLAAHLKVYAAGGENAIHTHSQEDHMFVILAGEATFRLGESEAIRVLRKNDGIMIPSGSYYWFLSSGDENLVLLRVGAKREGWTNFDDRVDLAGKPFAGDSVENKEQPVIPLPGKFFS
jgi:mannose-6-phosphate isomerase-like protein (cupin superfamily)